MFNRSAAIRYSGYIYERNPSKNPSKNKSQFDISGVGKYDTKTMYMDITQKISYRFIDIRTWAC